MELLATPPQVRNAVVIYHANCMDGFASAWAFHRLREKDYKEVEYFSCMYGEVPDVDFIGKDVYILDFSFSRQILAGMAIAANTITILDHHKTAQEDLVGWHDRSANVTILFDMDRSGAGLTWDYFGSITSRPLLISYVEDRDLWRFLKHKSKEINAVIANTDRTFLEYNELNMYLEHMFDLAEVVGKHLLRQHQRICEDIITQAREVRIQDDTGKWNVGLGCNCTHHFASEVGNLLAARSGTFGLTYAADGTGAVKHSIRSTGDFDVSRIAKVFGGGGHKNASGFTLHPNETDRSDTIKIWSIEQ
jgi:oligoribonuclease NrnB/cAMP/cGMP phosphodiesterase (DHH superfamily)